MFDIIVFGTGLSAETFINQLDKERTRVVAFLDNNEEKNGTYYYDIKIYGPDAISDISYDFIIIASQFVTPIYNQLIELNVPSDRIIPVYYELLLNQYEERYEHLLSGMLYHQDKDRVKKKISLVSLNNSGCNCRALAQYIPSEFKDSYEIQIMTNNGLDEENSDVIVTTHRNTSVRNNKINIELWHGFPLKGMYRMDCNRNPEETGVFENWKYAAGIASYSSLYTTLLNACFPTNINQYHITGMPRNDFLYHSDGRKHLKELFPEIRDDSFKLGYMPTFRMRKSYSKKELCEGKRPWNHLFDFPDYDEDTLFKFLEDHNITLILKLHTAEEEHFLDIVNGMLHNRVKLITSKMLEERDLDMYEILNAFDSLITDYSSVYFDYLLLDRPVIFTPTDIEEYRQSRGFLLEPYSFWAPGEHAIMQSQFIQAVKVAIQNPGKYAVKRKTICDLIHVYQDGRACGRVWDMIDRVVKDRSPLL